MHFATLDAPLAYWADQFPNRIALDDGTRQLSFAALHRAVEARAAYLRDIDAPWHVWLDATLWHDAPTTDDAGHAAAPTRRKAGYPGDLASATLSGRHDDPIARLRDFLAIIHSGRAAVVADDDWPDTVRSGLGNALADTPAAPPAPGGLTPFYVGFTSGSTGLPKGFRRHHLSWTESLRTAIAAFGPGAQSRVFCPGRLSHSLFLFGALQGLWTGAGVVLQQRFSAARAFETLRSGEHCVVAVPSQLAVMLDLTARRTLAPLTGVTPVMISGARWMRERTPALRACFPNARIVEFYGASETSFVAWTDADEHLPDAVVGRPFDNVEVRIQPLDATPGDDAEVSHAEIDGTDRFDHAASTNATDAVHALRPAEDSDPDARSERLDRAGLIFVRSPMLFNDYVYANADGAADETAAIRERDAGKGDWLSVRDVGYLDKAGRLCLIGRAKRMLVTQGKNLFPEEIESVLRAHPWIEEASVHGVHDPIRGRALVAAIRWRDMPAESDKRPALTELFHWCRARLEPYKTPRRFFVFDAETHWPSTTSGKTDHPAVAALLETACARDTGHATLRPL
ncbi:AMP-binding protein [Robbsia andropogonis]|uniref:AMP-binding protein n=1 Tax=Robbsia andropogonis TaxID=28092 RepID=UPI003D2159B4